MKQKKTAQARGDIYWSSTEVNMGRFVKAPCVVPVPERPVLEKFREFYYKNYMVTEESTTFELFSVQSYDIRNMRCFVH